MWRHNKRNALDRLPERERPAVKQRLRRAWTLDDHQRPLDQLGALAGELDRTYPGAAGSLRVDHEVIAASEREPAAPRVNDVIRDGTPPSGG